MQPFTDNIYGMTREQWEAYGQMDRPENASGREGRYLPIWPAEAYMLLDLS